MRQGPLLDGQRTYVHSFCRDIRNQKHVPRFTSQEASKSNKRRDRGLGVRGRELVAVGLRQY